MEILNGHQKWVIPVGKEAPVIQEFGQLTQEVAFQNVLKSKNASFFFGGAETDGSKNHCEFGCGIEKDNC